MQNGASTNQELEIQEIRSWAGISTSATGNLADSKTDEIRSWHQTATSSHSAHRKRSGVAAEIKKARKPISMQRAKHWSIEVENAFRFQLAGFKDEEEYLSLLGNHEPELWDPEGVIKCLRAKKTGYFMYFRRTRECEDKLLNRIILYQY